jgi:23S rRNA U2552 (ribose-2'-O)-methylase RlmE/FtsJ
MIYFLLPRLSNNTFKSIDYLQSDHPLNSISNSTSHYLYDIKTQINNYQHEWDVHKKYTNPYEYIHTQIHQKKKSIAKYKPLSRSFFKMIEISTTFNLYAISQPTKSNIQTFHLAEGPGGFIEAIAHLRKNQRDSYVGMTILSDEHDLNIPAWKKSSQFLKDNPNVYIETGADKTGDILSLANFIFCQEKYKSSMDIITGDGGFDFTGDFNNQENNISNLLFAQIAFALAMQKYGGSFVLKVFDIFLQHTVDMVAILASFYDQVYITKPQTSRYANSEKYIVCKGFIYESNDAFLPFLNSAFEKMVNNKSNNGSNNASIRYLTINIPTFFITKLEEYNSVFGQQQIENIHYTLSLIENRFKSDKIEALLKTNIQKCTQWCTQYNMQYNNIPVNLNIFLSNENVVDVRRTSCFIR